MQANQKAALGVAVVFVLLTAGLLYGWHRWAPSPEREGKIFDAAMRADDLERARPILERHPEWMTTYRHEKSGLTLLHVAAGRGSLRIGTYMLEHGADPNARTRDGKSVFDYALENDDAAFIKALVQHGLTLQPGDDFRDVPLHDALAAGNTEIANLLLDAGANIHARDILQQTPLHWAVMDQENADIITRLLKQGADIHARKSLGETPLVNAVRTRENAAVINLLLDAGADVNAQNKYGETPLMEAVNESGNELNVTVLLKRGAKINAKNHRGETPLILAAQRGDLSMVKLLVAHGANRRLRDKAGLTALQHAQQEPKLEGTFGNPADGEAYLRDQKASRDQVAAYLRSLGK